MITCECGTTYYVTRYTERIECAACGEVYIFRPPGSRIYRRTSLEAERIGVIIEAIHAEGLQALARRYVAYIRDRQN